MSLGSRSAFLLHIVHFLGNNPQCDVSGSTVHSKAQAQPSWCERLQAGALEPGHSLVSKVPHFELVKLQKA